MDFVFSEGSGMKYLQSLILKNQAFSFNAYAHSPTVTLPRVKALVSGGVPSFLEAIINFGGDQTLSTDNIISQFLKAGKKIAFYGDDTWLKTFPGHFFRFEGVTSFFVAVSVNSSS